MSAIQSDGSLNGVHDPSRGLLRDHKPPHLRYKLIIINDQINLYSVLGSIKCLSIVILKQEHNWDNWDSVLRLGKK